MTRKHLSFHHSLLEVCQQYTQGSRLLFHLDLHHTPLAIDRPCRKVAFMDVWPCCRRLNALLLGLVWPGDTVEVSVVVHRARRRLMKLGRKDLWYGMWLGGVVGRHYSVIMSGWNSLVMVLLSIGLS
jgi:hypothetical protein